MLSSTGRGHQILACDRDDGPGTSVPRVTDVDVADIEQVIDQIEADLPDLRNFILPAGGMSAAQIHFARTVCRRAERQVTALARVSAVSAAVQAYLNRLSDLLFVIAPLYQQ